VLSSRKLGASKRAHATALAALCSNPIRLHYRRLSYIRCYCLFSTTNTTFRLSDPASKNPAVNRMANIIPDPLAQGNDKEEDE